MTSMQRDNDRAVATGRVDRRADEASRGCDTPKANSDGACLCAISDFFQDDVWFRVCCAVRCVCTLLMILGRCRELLMVIGLGNMQVRRYDGAISPKA